MLKFKHLIYILILISVAGCKSSPTADEGPESSIINPDASIEAVVSDTAVESKEEITSSASTTSNSADASLYSVQPGEFNLYPRETNGWDESGWSIITPSEDSRLIYVSFSSGNDETAEFYAPRDVDSIQDPGLIKPYKTIEAANLNARDGYPDWILLQRGDIWEVSGAVHLKGGRSVDERSVFTSYGKNTDRPVITNSGGKDILRVWIERRFVGIVGISFYGIERDPSAQEFVGWGNVEELRGIFIYGPAETRMGSILIEDNRFNFLSKAISISGQAEHVDIVVRRNIIRNSYNELGHAQGMSAANTSALLEENIFDHNGWLTQQAVKDMNTKDEGQATMFNHNTYFTTSMNTVFRNNIFLRPSSMQNKWTANPPTNTDEIMSRNLLMENNLYVGGEIGISAGGNDDNNTGHRWKDITIRNNVMLAIGRDRPTNRTLGWSIDATDWDGGLICGNYLLHTDNPLVSNLLGINLSGHSRDVVITKNTIHGLISPNPSSRAGAITVNPEPKVNILIAENNIQLINSSMRLIVASQLDSITFQENNYFSALHESEWFRSGDTNYDVSGWNSVSGDITSTVGQDYFLQPKRTFETYLDSIGSSSMDTYIEEASNQSPRVWSENFSAKRINAYIREGYGNTTCN